MVAEILVIFLKFLYYFHNMQNAVQSSKYFPSLSMTFCHLSGEFRIPSRKNDIRLESSCGTHFPSSRIFPISCNRLETVSLSTPNCCASSFRVFDGFSFNNASKAPVFDVSGVPKRCRSLTSKSPALKLRNQYLQVLWQRTPSPSTGNIDLHASAVFFPCRNS
uniref:Secreted protein n=1 Tax=Heterorhabditis bacteriophora TaxID=37862 RepID=A0A1I7WHB0_HETBA